MDATGDRDFLKDVGAEILVDTARLWVDLGFFGRHDGKFRINGVTGPDEYNTVVNNNLYTNLMARENLWYAVETIGALSANDPQRFASLVRDTGLRPDEIDAWRQAADRMYLPYDERDGVHLQDDSFKDKQDWDFDSTPAEKYPLLLHYHPLVIYRYRVVKQADVVLAMFLLGHEFSHDQKRRNFVYYDRLTTRDSSLSCSIESIIAAEVGEMDKAFSYSIDAGLMDLADVAGNVQDGCHVASMGGFWMTLIYGFAGMRDAGGRISFAPKVPVAARGVALLAADPRAAAGGGSDPGVRDLHGQGAGSADHNPRGRAGRAGARRSEHPRGAPATAGGRRGARCDQFFRCGGRHADR